MPSLSLCMIVRDEEKNIGRILRQIKSIPDEIIIVDTGSTDKTKEVAKAICPEAVLFDYVWQDHFAAARNFSINQASKEFILIMDADDSLPDESIEALKNLKETLKPDSAYYFWLTNPGVFDQVQPARMHFPQIRIFPNRPDLRYKGRAHNEIDSAVMAAGLKEIMTFILIEHMGYDSEETLRAKHARTFGILLKEKKETPKDPRVNLYLGMHYAQYGQWEQAKECLEIVAEALYSDRERRPWGLYLAYLHLMEVFYNLGDRHEAARYWTKLSEMVAGGPWEQAAVELAEDLDLYGEISKCVS